MSKLAISQTPTTITVVDQTTAKVYTITNSQPNWSKVVEAIREEDNDDEILQTISVKAAVENFSPNGSITVFGNDVKYKGFALAGLDVDHLLEAIRTGNKRQAKALTSFLENKQANPSYKAVGMMYKFRQDKGMPLTDDGHFLAYKGVLKDYWSRNANKTTIVLHGQTNENGQILNRIGDYIEVDRKCVEDDPAKSCGPGLHAGSLEYATGWGERVIIVKIHPKDVVSVPDHEDNKMRVCAYTVVGECEGRMSEHFAKELDNDVESEPEGESEVYCSECEELVDPDAEFCDNCGAEVIPDDADSDHECECGHSTCKSVVDAPEKATFNSKYHYDTGYQRGVREGTSKVARRYYEGDELKHTNGTADYISGYNAGYKSARYGK